MENRAAHSHQEFPGVPRHPGGGGALSGYRQVAAKWRLVMGSCLKLKKKTTIRLKCTRGAYLTEVFLFSWGEWTKSRKFLALAIHALLFMEAKCFVFRSTPGSSKTPLYRPGINSKRILITSLNGYFSKFKQLRSTDVIASLSNQNADVPDVMNSKRKFDVCLMEHFCLAPQIGMPLFFIIHLTNLSRQSIEQ